MRFLRNLPCLFALLCVLGLACARQPPQVVPGTFGVALSAPADSPDKQVHRARAGTPDETGWYLAVSRGARHGLQAATQAAAARGQVRCLPKGLRRGLPR